MQVNLSTTDRSTLIRSILQSDIKYLELLLERKRKLIQEFDLLDLSITKKVQEIQGMRMQLDFTELYN